MRRLLSIVLTMLGLNLCSFSQGDLLITPTRVVFDGDKQKEELNLVNIGNDTAVYSISFIQYKMNEDGSFTLITTPDSLHKFADPYLRVFPRKVTLAPREPQVIMLQRKRVPDMLAGEYRSHLYFRSEKNNSPLGLVNPAKDSSKIDIQLIPIYGLSIPVIIRSGETNIKAELTGMKLEKLDNSSQELKITINRTGNISSYGDIIVKYIPVKGKPEEIGVIKGVGVYTDINKREVSVRLKNTFGLLTDGKLNVQYVNTSEANHAVYTSKELEIK